MIARAFSLFQMAALAVSAEGDCDNHRLCNALVDFAECLEGRYCQFHTKGFVVERTGAEVPVFCTALDATACSFRSCEDIIGRAEVVCTDESEFSTVDKSLLRLSKDFCEKHGMSCRDLAAEKAEDDAKAKEEEELKKATEEATKKAEEEEKQEAEAAKVEEEKETGVLLTKQILSGNTTSLRENQQKKEILEDQKEAEENAEEEVDQIEGRKEDFKDNENKEEKKIEKGGAKGGKKQEKKAKKKGKKAEKKIEKEVEQTDGGSCEKGCSSRGDKCITDAMNAEDTKKISECAITSKSCIVDCSSELTTTTIKLLSADGHLAINQGSATSGKAGPEVATLAVCGVVAVAGIVATVHAQRIRRGTIEEAPIAAVASL